MNLKGTVRRLLHKTIDGDGQLHMEHVLAMPHALYGIANLLLETFLEADLGEGVSVNTLAGDPRLATALGLSAGQYDPQYAPLVIVNHDQMGLVDDNSRVAIVVPEITDGVDEMPAIDHFEERAKVVLLLAVVNKGGRRGVSSDDWEVPVVSLFNFNEVSTVTPEDHLLFVPDPDGGDGFYMQSYFGSGWAPCTPEQNEELAKVPEEDRVAYTPKDTNLSGAEAFGVFYIRGVLRP